MRERERESERENSHSKTLNTQAYLTASPCYTRNTNKRDNTTKEYNARELVRAHERERATDRQTDRQTDRDRDREINAKSF